MPDEVRRRPADTRIHRPAGSVDKPDDKPDDKSVGELVAQRVPDAHTRRVRAH
jgi:hypothetical protein